MRYLLAALAAVALLAGCSGDPPAWRMLESAPDARTDAAGAALNGRVAVVGGVDADGRASARVDVYDPRRARWLRLPDLPEARAGAMAVTRGGRLYVVGGYRPEETGGAPADTAWVLFDRRWRPLPRLPEPRAAGGAAIVRNKLYVVGGVRGPGPTALATTSLYLDLRTLGWRAFRGLTPPRARLGVTALMGRVYAVGGRAAAPRGDVATAEVYDTVARGWSALPDAPTARSGSGAVAADRRVVVLGGERAGGADPAAEAFDPTTGAWRSLPPSPRPRDGAAVVGIGRTAYQALGAPEPGLSVSPTLMALRAPRAD